MRRKPNPHKRHRHTKKRMSISRWAKVHHDRLSRVDFTVNIHDVDRNWRNKKEYDRWRRDVLTNDNFRCVHCGTQDQLTVHHKIPAIVAAELRYEVINGETLCDACHRTQLHQYDVSFWLRLIDKSR